MLITLGASHRDLEPSGLDRLSTGSDTLLRSLCAAAGAPASPIAGVVTLSTCNRLEIYLDAHRFHDAVETVIGVVAEAAEMAADEVGAQLKVRVGSQVAAHLFTVAAGLDSIVVGEAEISGQVGSALRSAQQAGAVTPSLNRLFQTAARTAKKVASETALGSAGRSVASVALDLASDGADLGSVLVVEPALWPGSSQQRSRHGGARSCSCTRRADVLRPSPNATTPGLSCRRTFPLSSRASVWSWPAAGAVTRRWTWTRCAVDWSGVRASYRSSIWRFIPTSRALVRTLEGVRVIDLADVAAAVQPAHQEAVVAAGGHRRHRCSRVRAGHGRTQPGPGRDSASATCVRRGGGGARAVRGQPRAGADRGAGAGDASLAQSLLHVPTVRARELARNGDESDYLHALSTLFGIDIAGSGESSASSA